jgi:integrase
MGTVYKKTFTKPLPASAELFSRKGEQFAKWLDAKGKTRSAPVTTGRDGQLRLLLESRCYLAKFRDGQGIVQEISTHCYDEQAARQVLADQIQRAERVKGGILTSAEDAVIDHLTTPLDDHINDYLNSLEAGRTCAEYRGNVSRQLRRLTADCGFCQLSDLNAASASKWLVIRAKEGMGARTQNSYRTAAVAFGNWLVDQGRLLAHPFKKLPIADEKVDRRRQRRALTEAEIAKLLDVARRRPLLEAMTVRRGKQAGQAAAKLRPEVVQRLELLGRERALIYRTLLLTGLRKGELASITIGQLCLNGPCPFIELDAADEKNREGSQIPLRGDLAAELSAWIELKRERSTGELDANERAMCLRMTVTPYADPLPANTPLFNVPDKLVKILDRDLVHAGIARRVKVDGKWRIDKRDERGRTLDVHALRHSFCTMLSKSGVTPRVAQAAMRHSDIKLTMVTYTDPKLLDLRQAVESLPELALDGGEAVRNQQRATGTYDARPSLAPVLAPIPGKSSKSESIAVTMTDDEENLPRPARERVSGCAVKENDPLSTSDSGSGEGWLTGFEPVTPRTTI